jgi:DNA transformation protein and related proteins
MNPSAEYKEYILAHLEPIIPLKTTRFFGGIGLVYESVQFGMMIGNNLYFVVDESTQAKYLQAGMQSFSYMTKKGCIQVRRYFELREEVLTDAKELQAWAAESIQIANKTKKPAKKNVNYATKT